MYHIFVMSALRKPLLTQDEDITLKYRKDTKNQGLCMIWAVLSRKYWSPA